MLKKSRKESELNTVESQIRGLETRLKYNKSDLVATVSILFKYCYIFKCLFYIHIHIKLIFKFKLELFQKKQIAELDTELSELEKELNKFGVRI